jgi:hypothetical protein
MAPGFEIEQKMQSLKYISEGDDDLCVVKDEVDDQAEEKDS